MKIELQTIFNLGETVFFISKKRKNICTAEIEGMSVSYHITETPYVMYKLSLGTGNLWLAENKLYRTIEDAERESKQDES